MSKTYLRAVDDQYFDHPRVIARERIATYRMMKKSEPQPQIQNLMPLWAVTLIILCGLGLVFLFMSLVG